MTKEDNNDAAPHGPVDEPTATFRAISDLSCYSVKAGGEPLVEISGYGLQIRFNFRLMRTPEDVEEACDGLRGMFRSLMTERLLAGDAQGAGRETIIPKAEDACRTQGA